MFKKSAVIAIAAAMLATTACQEQPAATSADGQKTVTISVMTSDRFLELAKQKFEASHPDIRIEIKESVAAPPMPAGGPGPAGSAGPGGKGASGMNSKSVMLAKPDPKNIEKYVSTVNTELMSGKASDIIAMDNLPFKKYADKNLLANIKDLMSKDGAFSKEDYYTSIFDALEYKGGLYEVPIKVGLNMMLGNQAALAGEKIDDSKWTWEDFAALGKKLKSGANGANIYPLNAIEPDELITMLVGSSFSQFVDTSGKKAKFDSPAFAALLKQAKLMYDNGLIAPQKVDSGSTVFQYKGGIRDYMDMMAMPQMYYDGKGEYYRLPSENKMGGTSFKPELPLAINNKSPNKQEAWEFVKFLLSTEMQSAVELGGIAVNKQGAKAQLDELRKIGQDQGGMKKQIRLMVDGKQFAPKPATDAEIARIEKVIADIRGYSESDPKITSIVAAETAPFFQGSKTAEDVAKIIQNKVSTYLQE
jgi:multiple sugar transport system substrate-binding protein